jgi:hypothetical protein
MNNTIIIHKIPFKCPVCNGSGIVPTGFYHSTSGHYLSTNASPEGCRSCGGSGIVYSEGTETGFCTCGIRYAYYPSGNCINCNKPLKP